VHRLLISLENIFVRIGFLIGCVSAIICMSQGLEDIFQVHLQLGANNIFSQ
jgi:hypothetical protein